MRLTELAIILAFVSMTAGAKTSHAQPASEPHTVEAVIAADKAWTVAEEKGDITFIDALLEPEYRSVTPDGSIHDKAAIVAGARKAAPERAAMIEKYLAEHPIDMSVVISGDTAVLTFTHKGDDKKRITSSDIFVYRAGHWHAIYSQHTTAEAS